LNLEPSIISAIEDINDPNKIYLSNFFSGGGGLFFGDNRSDLPPRSSRRKSSFDLNVRPANGPWWQ